MARACSPRKPSEEGFTVLVAIFLLALLTLSLAIAVPRITKEIQRERELEAMHRGKQYTRAIQLYYRKFHRYPPNIDALVNTNDIRFLRKRYIDPISRKDDWRPIFFGQNKLPTAIGFFGMTLSGLPIAPIGSDANGTTGAAGGSSASSGLSGSSGAFGSSSGLSGSSGAFGSNGGLSGSSGGFGSSSGLSGSSGGFGSSGGLSSSSSSDTQSFGNTALIGVTIPNEKHSMLVYKRQQQYDMWEFTYDPIVDSPTMPGGGAGGLGGASAAPSSGGLGGLAPSPGGIGGFAPSPSGTTPNSPFGTNSNQPSQSPQQ
jgi:type II secretory pathway pseudopilin PulG